MAHAFKATIVEVRAVAPDHVELLLESPELSQAIPGQFCHVLTPGMLRRPISFSRIDAQRHQVGLLFQVVGSGTAWLAQRAVGESLDVMGPLGRGYEPPVDGRPWLLVGGGVGIPPLFAALERWGAGRRQPIQVVLGARRGDYLIMQDDFRALGVTPVLTTDDGSLGQRGTVIPAVIEWMVRQPESEVMACGPTPMLAALASAVPASAGPVQLALEQRMGCGIGACLACVVPAQPVGPEGPRYRRVCTEGPVFRREELVF